MNFSAKIKINNIDYDCHAKDSELVITNSDIDFWKEREKIGWSDILNEWIEILSDDEFDIDSNGRKKYLMLLSYEFSGKGVLRLHIISCIDLLERNDSEKSNNLIKHITIRSKVVDMFYWTDKTQIEIKEICTSTLNSEQGCSKELKHGFELGGKKINLYFSPVAIRKQKYLAANVFEGVDIVVVLNVECAEGLTANETLDLCNCIKAFLSFVSNSREVVLEEILININHYTKWKESLANYPNGKMFISQETNRNDEITNIIPYSYIKENISSIFGEIANKGIRFISLFQYDKNVISSVDVMNICATFESQFGKTFPEVYEFDNKTFKETKEIITNIIEQLKIQPIFDCKILSKFVRYNNDSKNTGSLKFRLNYALKAFEEMDIYKNNKKLNYWEFYIKRIGGENYKEMPKRMYNARNPLSHGGIPKDRQALTDTILLRAIVYMLILKKADVIDENIIKCIKALFCS